ncbi:MAG: TIGR01906 family membrane protein [Candidatus Spyradocola sp.]|nr:TIGR01906 family membrane protein [Candidatus Spyradocola sp.]
MKKTVAAILSGAAAWLLLLAMLLGGVFVCTTSTAFYEHEYKKYNNAAVIGISDENLMNVTRGLLGYLWGSRDSLDMQAEIGGQLREVFTQREKDHMVDVRNLVTLARWAMVAFAVLGAAAWVGAALLARREKHGLRVCGIGYLAGAVLLLALVGIVVLLAMQDFTAVFIKFHQIFFTNDLWLLDADDMLIQMVPEPFFMDCAALIAILFAVGLAATAAIAIVMICRKDKTEEGNWPLTRVGGANGDDFYKIEHKEKEERPDASEIFARMGLEDGGEEEELPVTNIEQAEPATARPAAPRVGEPLTPENGELSVRFEMKLDMKVEKSEDGRLVLVVDPDSKPHVSLTSSPGQLTFAIGGGNGALPRGEERAHADVCIEEKVPMPEARPRIVEPAPSPEELLQQMDELMKGFPKGDGEGGR